MNMYLGRRSIVALVVVSSFLMLPQLAFSSQSTPKLELTLLVYTYTDFSTYQTKKIRERVASIFENPGIRIKWLDCSPGSEDHQVPATCTHAPGLSDLVIRLLDQSTTSKAGLRMTPVGHSYASGRGGWYGSVSCAIVRELARGNRSLEIEILGHAIAHEIGHLLLGANAHSSTGIMKPFWKEKDMSQIVKTNGLLFSEEQAKRLRMCLSARHKTEESAHS